MLGTSEIKGSSLKFEVVTTYAQKHWDSHASKCVSTFEEYWEDVPMVRFTDEGLELYSSWLAEFKKANAYRPTNNYRFDAVRFSHKVAAIELAYQSCEADVLIWMDADCVTHSPVDTNWLQTLIGDADLAILNRTKKYTEGGFIMFRKCRSIDLLIGHMVDMYVYGHVFGLKEWHDCEVLDTCRKMLGVKFSSLSGDFADTGHPLVNGPLGERLDHLKGKRKQAGKSLRSDLKSPRKELYWK